MLVVVLLALVVDVLVPEYEVVLCLSQHSISIRERYLTARCSTGRTGCRYSRYIIRILFELRDYSQVEVVEVVVLVLVVVDVDA